MRTLEVGVHGRVDNPHATLADFGVNPAISDRLASYVRGTTFGHPGQSIVFGDPISIRHHLGGAKRPVRIAAWIEQASRNYGKSIPGMNS